MVLGIVPVNLLGASLRKDNFVSAPIMLGMVPLKRHLSKRRKDNRVNAPIVLGSVPRIPPQKYM